MTIHKTEPVLRMEQVSINDGGRKIFEKVSLTVRKAEFVSVKGPSGCGKTTLLRVMSGLVEPVSGKIYINGLIANDPKILIPPHLRRMNLLFQELALWPHMTGLEQLRFVWESNPRGTFETACSKICDDIGFPEKLLSRYPSKLSRGEQQRLAIARSIISDPEVLLLDEPLTALDAGLRNQLVTFFLKLKKKKTTAVILVSHDLMTDVLDYDRRFVFFNNSFIETNNG